MMLMWRLRPLMAATLLASAQPALAQQQGVTLFPRSAIGVLMMVGTDSAPSEFSGHVLLDRSSDAPGLWGQITLLELRRIGLHVGVEISEWVDHPVSIDRAGVFGFAGPVAYTGSFQHKDFVANSLISFRPGDDRVRPVWLLGAAWVRSRYFIANRYATPVWREQREETAAAPALLVGVELPVNPKGRVTFTARVQGRFVAWLPEVRHDGFGVVSLIAGAGLEFRLR